MKDKTFSVLFWLAIIVAYFVFVMGVIGIVWLIMRLPHVIGVVVLTALAVLFFLIIAMAMLSKEDE